MKAVVFHAHGGREQLRYDEVPEPGVRADHVLVRVRACALNHLDLWVRQGIPGRTVPLPHISGSDVAGDVEDVGALVTGISRGDRVMISPGLSCAHCLACLRGEDNFCPHYDILGSRSQGGYAEYVAVPAVNVIPMPAALTYEQAAAIPLVFVTAWHMVVTRAAVRCGEEVLVMAAGSGVGSAALQIAHLLGARVIATAGTDEKCARARALGAAATINHTTQDLVQEVKRYTEGRGVDVIVEHVGAAVWEKCVLALARGGRLVTCGATTGPDGPTDLRYLFGRHLSILGSFMGTKAELLEAVRHVTAGTLAPVVDSVFPLRDAAAAQQKMEERAFFGKIVLSV